MTRLFKVPHQETIQSQKTETMRQLDEIKAELEKEYEQLQNLHEEQTACLQRLIDLKNELMEVTHG